MLRRRSIGADGAESEFCDLSGRGLTSSQVERTLRVFESAIAIDMSNNELEEVPTTIPKDVIALDISFNLLANAYNIERLKQLREVHLGYNRLGDVSILEYCPLLQRVNVSGNRLLNTKGLETLLYLECLDLSDNLIEFPDALRALSLNQNLTQLRLQGNPLTIKADVRLVVMEMIPSVLLLDEKKIRNTSKSNKLIQSLSTKTLSYARIYNDKKHFMIHTQSTRIPANHHPTPVLVGCDPVVNNGPYNGSTMFLQNSPTKSVARVANTERLIRRTSVSPRRNEGNTSPDRSRIISPKSGQPYISMFDRLAQANGISTTETKQQTDTPMPISVTEPASDRRQSNKSRKSIAPTRKDSNASRTTSMFRQQSIQTPSQQQSILETPTAPPPPPIITARPATPTQNATAAQSRPYSPAYQPQPLSQTVQSRQSISIKPAPSQISQIYSNTQQYIELQPTLLSQTRSPISGPRPNSLDSKQQNVLNVIQNLIQHKKQTLATLAPQTTSNVVYSQIS